MHSLRTLTANNELGMPRQNFSCHMLWRTMLQHWFQSTFIIKIYIKCFCKNINIKKLMKIIILTSYNDNKVHNYFIFSCCLASIYYILVNEIVCTIKRFLCHNIKQVKQPSLVISCHFMLQHFICHDYHGIPTMSVLHVLLTYCDAINFVRNF